MTFKKGTGAQRSGSAKEWERKGAGAQRSGSAKERERKGAGVLKSRSNWMIQIHEWPRKNYKWIPKSKQPIAKKYQISKFKNTFKRFYVRVLAELLLFKVKHKKTSILVAVIDCCHSQITHSVYFILIPVQSMKERVLRNAVPEQRSDFLWKGTERGIQKGTERGTERSSNFLRNERNGIILPYFWRKLS